MNPLPGLRWPTWREVLPTLVAAAVVAGGIWALADNREVVKANAERLDEVGERLDCMRAKLMIVEWEVDNGRVRDIERRVEESENLIDLLIEAVRR